MEKLSEKKKMRTIQPSEPCKKYDNKIDNNTIRALPPLPPAPPPGADPDSGPLLPIPPEIRPTLVKYR